MDQSSAAIWLYSIVKNLFGVCVATALSFSPTYTAYRSPVASMEPTILVGDYILAKKIANEIQRGDIVTFEAPASVATATDKSGKPKLWLKRVLGLPGDKIEIRKRQLFVNDRSLSEPYCIHNSPTIYPGSLGKIRNYQTLWESGGFTEMRPEEIGDHFGPIFVPKDSYFVLGDNRDYSYDSRYWGPLPRERIVGKAFKIYAPLSRAKEL